MVEIPRAESRDSEIVGLVSETGAILGEKSEFQPGPSPAWCSDCCLRVVLTCGFAMASTWNFVG